MGIIDHHSALNILISVKGHPFERDAFAAVFESFEGIRHTIVEQPASQSFPWAGETATGGGLLLTTDSSMSSQVVVDAFKVLRLGKVVAQG